MGKQRNKKSSRAESEADSAHSLSPSPERGRGIVITICVFLTATTWLVFGQTLGHDFINYDDPGYVYENSHITSGLSVNGIGWAFTNVHAGNWHPLTTLSHMLDCQLFDLSATGHHFTNVLFHTIVVLLLFYLLRQITGKLWPSAFVAGLFAIHPLRVESVAWISERKDVLSGIFFMLTLISYVRYVRHPSISRYGLLSILFVCGLMSKPMLVTVPIVLLLIDWWPLQRFINGKSISALIIEKIPLFILSMASAVVTLIAQRQSVGSTNQLPISLRIGNAIVSYLIYLWKTVWPTNLAPFYPHPETAIPLWITATSAALLMAITGVALVLRKRYPYVLTGWLWYVVMLVPVIGVIQVGWQARADRYTYLSEIGIYLAVTWATIDFVASWRHRRTLLSALATAVILLLASLARIQTSYWKDNETLWTHTIAVTQDNDVAQNNLGTVLFQHGQLDAALSHFELATRVRSGNAAAQDNLARVLRRKGRIAEAIAHCRKALDIEPDKIETRDMLGTMLFQQGDVEAAIAEWREVLKRQPDSYAQNSLAWVLATYPDSSIRDGAKAVELARKALELSEGNSATLLRTLAAAYAESGRFSEAIETAQGAQRLAIAQENPQLANEFEREIAQYRKGLPLRASPPNRGDSGQ